MSDDLVSLKVIVVSPSIDCRVPVKGAAAACAIPIELAEVDGASAAAPLLAGGADIVLIDGELPAADHARICSAARSAPKAPFTVLLATPGNGAAFEADARAERPSSVESARSLIDGLTKVRLSSRVLLVDDSSTMRNIVRKILGATRFPFQITEATAGAEALEIARTGSFDIIFLDYHMPGFNGLDTVAEFRRERQHAVFVLMTSAHDDALAERARSQGVGFLKKPFYPADIEAILAGFYGLEAINSRPA
jgi:CheY-like chemotaxis protein